MRGGRRDNSGEGRGRRGWLRDVRRRHGQWQVGLGLCWAPVPNNAAAAILADGLWTLFPLPGWLWVESTQQAGCLLPPLGGQSGEFDKQTEFHCLQRDFPPKKRWTSHGFPAVPVISRSVWRTSILVRSVTGKLAVLQSNSHWIWARILFLWMRRSTPTGRWRTESTYMNSKEEQADMFYWDIVGTLKCFLCRQLLGKEDGPSTYPTCPSFDSLISECQRCEIEPNQGWSRQSGMLWVVVWRQWCIFVPIVWGMRC